MSGHSGVDGMGSYLESAGYIPAEITAVDAHGATQCEYYRVTCTDEKQIFIKTGEKVAAEVRWLGELSSLGAVDPSILLPGSSTEPPILITPYASQPDFGYQTVKEFHDVATDGLGLFGLQHQVIHEAARLYCAKGTKDTANDSPSIFATRIGERLNVLQDSRSIPVDLDNARIPLADLVHAPLELTIGAVSVRVGSIVSACADVQRGIDKSEPLEPRIVHGDLHAPNIAKDDDDRLRIVDWSDVRVSEDPAWDLGKWLNYVTRFYAIAQLRAGDGSAQSESWRIDGSESVLAFEFTGSLSKIAAVREAAIAEFSSILDEDPDLVAQRAAAAEFIVNISTLLRHACQYPETVLPIVGLICKSYVDYKELVS